MALIITLHSNCNSAVHEIWLEYKIIKCANYLKKKSQYKFYAVFQHSNVGKFSSDMNVVVSVKR